MKYTKILIAACLAMAATQAQAASFGYCTDAAARNGVFRMGSTEKQGMAIRLDAGKVAALKGQTITGMSLVFGSSRTTDGNATLFIGTDPNAPAVTQTVKIATAVKWLEYSLDTPYTITGEEDELYIGYTAEISTKSSMLMSDRAADTEGRSYVYSDGLWVDTQGLGVGNVSVRFNIADAPALTDVTLKPINVEGYYKAGESYEYSAEILNFGTEAIHTFDLNVSVGDAAPVTTKYEGLDIAQGNAMSFTIPGFAAQTDGSQYVKIEVANVNGTTDVDATDNAFDADVYYYPANMERSIMIEGFTGQTCSNCPSGHATLEAFIETVDLPVIEVMHHAGYNPDFMTMNSDLDYTYFYGSASTFAPAIMVNRTHVPTIGTVPVMQISANNLNAALTTVSGMQPYVSLSIESTYDLATREVNVKVLGQTHNDMPEGMNIINVMLVQDGIKGLQLPVGADYTHNGVFRGVLTGNSWGKLLDQEMTAAGGSMEWSSTFTLPQGIFSDAYNWNTMSDAERELYTTVTVPEDMRIVAYVAAYDGNNVNNHVIYNAVQTRLGESYTQSGMASIEGIETDDDPGIKLAVIDGRIHVLGDYDSLNVYTLAGQEVNAQAALRAGIYVARVTSNGVVTSYKLLVTKIADLITYRRID